MIRKTVLGVLASFVLASVCSPSRAQLRVEHVTVDQFTTKAEKFDALYRQIYALTKDVIPPKDFSTAMSISQEAGRARDSLNDFGSLLAVYAVFPRQPNVNAQLDLAVRNLVQLQIERVSRRLQASTLLIDAMSNLSQDKTLLFFVTQVRDELKNALAMVLQIKPQ